MSNVIFKSDRWLIIQDPMDYGHPELVRFVKHSAVRKLLDQTARWTPVGWDQTRWAPRAPIVPQTILSLVEAHMRGLVQ